MKRIVQAVFLAASFLALAVALYFLIQGRSGAAAASRPVATRQVVAESTKANGGDVPLASGDATAVNHIPALQNELILSVTTINIDEDEGQEQVLTVRKTDRADGRLVIVVADYLPSKKNWQRSWEGETLCTKLTTFTIQAEDLLGDHGLELVCTGMNDSGEQTISVFRRLGSTGQALGYGDILTASGDSIQIGETERPEAYQQGSGRGESWPIYVLRGDKDSPNLFDQVKERYEWDPKGARYAMTGKERIPGAQVERETVSKVLTGSEKDFEAFLQGVWYEAGKGPSDPGTRLVMFDKDARRISFYGQDSQEAFRWVESHSTRYGLYVRCQNDSIEDLYRLIDIELTGSDLVSMRIYEDIQSRSDPNDSWDGSFRKMPRDLPPKADGSPPIGEGRGLGSPPIKLEGPYRSASGMELSFAYPRYSLKSGAAQSESGGFQLYTLGPDTVLELIAIGSDGLPAGRRSYKASFAETKNGKDILRRLVLSPATVTIDGLELLRESDIALEQRVKG
jgi:hypothetical protein